MLPTLSPQQYVNKWRRTELRERAGAHEHFIDLCHLVGHPTPAEVDRTGDTFTFEKGASKHRGGKGWADVWKKGSFGWEFKGNHANLDDAYEQLLRYKDSLLSPPLLIVSDFERIIIQTNITNTVKRTEEIALADLTQPEQLERLRQIFFEPFSFQSSQTTEKVTERAASEFAQVADVLRKYGTHPQRAAHFLIRILFCMFAEDTGLLQNHLFSQLVANYLSDPLKMSVPLGQLFSAMAVGGAFGVERIAHFDGSLFDDSTVLELGSDGLPILHRVSALDWSSIEPSVFGTLFERSLDPAKRAQLGAHYTSKNDILLVVEPVLMAPLRRRWTEVGAQAHALAERRDAAVDQRQEVLSGELRSLLQGFASELAQIRVLDPACGSGNFLYLALRQLLDLEKEVITLANDLGVGGLTPRVSPRQLHGIEINVYARELAQTTIWIGYIQWLRENGFLVPSEPILQPLETIVRMDAILSHDAEGKPVEPDWPEADVIIGNPPFVGGNKIRQELGDRYVDELFTLYKGRVPAFADLVCYWFEKARALIETGKVKRAGLLATQGIRGGVNRRVLEHIKETGDIFMAWGDRRWILEGAAVHVSMIGFDNGSEATRTLDGQPVSSINANLTAGVNLTIARILPENLNLAFQGPSPKAPFDIDASVARPMLAEPLNVNGRPNTDVVRPVASAIDLGQGSRNKWTIDFALMSLEEASQYEKPFEYVRKVVLPARQDRRDDYRGQWWQYARPRPEMREALNGKNRYIATPRVSKHRIFVWLAPKVLANDGTIAIARDDDYFFGVLHSRPHELWARGMGTQLREAESGFRYTPTTTFETFPFPWPPGQEPAGDPKVGAIAEAARELVEKRDHWLNPEGADKKELRKRTLTNLYNQRPTWLDLAHQQLDRAVFDAYNWPHDLTDEEILTRLLVLNLERSRQNNA